MAAAVDRANNYFFSSATEGSEWDEALLESSVPGSKVPPLMSHKKMKKFRYTSALTSSCFALTEIQERAVNGIAPHALPAQPGVAASSLLRGGAPASPRGSGRAPGLREWTRTWIEVAGALDLPRPGARRGSPALCT